MTPSNTQFGSFFMRFEAALGEVNAFVDGADAHLHVVGAMLTAANPVTKMLERLAAVTNRVCRIVDMDTQHELGTGVLIGPDLVLTANHVIDGSDLSLTVCEFNNVTFGPGTVISDPPTVVGVAKACVDQSRCAIGDAVTAATLDFALLRTSRRLGDDARGFVEAAPVGCSEGDSIYVVEHVGMQPVAFACGAVTNAFDAAVHVAFHHSAESSPGTSGSPIFDEQFRLIGIHRGGLPNSADKEGISIAWIYRQLHDHGILPVP
jgi:S1-C subfamily serine protease